MGNQGKTAGKDHRYHLMMDFAPDGIFIMNMDGTLNECNRQAASMLGYTKAELLTLSIYDWDDMIHHADLPKLIDSVTTVPVYFETQLKRKNSTVYNAAVTAVKIEIDHQTYIYANVRDITAQKSTELILRDVLSEQNNQLKRQQEVVRLQEDELKLIFDLSQDGLAILDLNTRFIKCNQAYFDMTGYSEAELLQHSCVDLTVEKDLTRTKEAMDYVVKNGSIKNFEKSCYRKDKAIITVSMGITLTPDKKYFIVSAKDITHIKKVERKLKNIAHYDQLTKLPNRYLLHDRLYQSIRLVHQAKKVMAVAYLDLDGFKQVNDTFGHDVGDHLLQLISKKMSAVLRLDDTIARLGGDEFVIILNGLDNSHGADAVLRRILKVASTPLTINSHLINTVSASIGVTFYSARQDRIDGDTLLRQADQAMYEAKAHGKNRVVVYHEK